VNRVKNVGPQQTIYVPVEWLKQGYNEVFVLELLKPEQNVLRGIDKTILDRLQ
jgi:beta-galactosidase